MGKSLGDYLDCLLMQGDPAHYGQYHSLGRLLDCIRKLAEHEPMSKPASSMLPWFFLFLFFFLLQVPALTFSSDALEL